MRRLAISALAVIIAFVTVFLTNLALSSLIEAVAPEGLSADGIPITWSAQALVIAVNFVAGAGGTVVIVLLAPNKPTMHALVFLGIVVLLDIAAAVVWWGLVPMWFTGLIIVLAPLQVGAGAILGLSFRRKWWGAVEPTATSVTGG